MRVFSFTVVFAIYKVEWERERKEKQDSLNRFLATWEKLHAGSEAPPTAPPPRPTKTASKKRQKTLSEERGERKKRGEKMEERERGVESTNSDEEDIVEDFHFSSSDSDSD